MKAKKYAKIGKKPGRPSYRTPSDFKYQKTIKNKINKARKSGLEEKKILEYNKNNK
jgi:hypothetical protein